MNYALLFSLILYSTAFSQWITTNTTSNGPELNSIYFTDDENGWIAGERGTILKLNSNFRWEKQNSNTSNHLMSIAFFDNETGFAVGKNGTIIKSTNGGESWFGIQEDSSYNLNFITIVNDSVLYTAGSNSKVLKSTDGGLTWENSETKVLSNFNNIYFVDENLGYVGGDNFSLIKTTNGGFSWYSIELPFEANIESIYFLDSLNGYVGTEDEFETGRLMFTSDGGENWIEKDVASGGIQSMCFNNINEGLFVTGSGTRYRKICTFDGLAVNLKYFHEEEYDLLSCFITPSGNGWAVGGGGAIFYAEDFNDDWEQLFYGNSEINYALTNVSDDVIIAGSRDNFREPYGKLFKLNSSNEFWEQLIKPNSDSNDFFAFYTISALDSTHLYAGGEYGWYFSSDKGLTWRKNINLFTVKELQFLSNAIGYSANPFELLKTSDGGENWTSLTFTFPVSEMFFINENLGFIASASDNGYQIHKTTDGGVNWILTSVDNLPKITSMFFINENIGFVVGWLNTILKTTNGGTTWSSYSGLKINNPVEYKTIYVENVKEIPGSPFNIIVKEKDSNKGYITTPTEVGNNSFITFKNAIGYITQDGGKILRTFDFGETWETINTNLNDDFISLAIMDNGFTALLSVNNAYLNATFGSVPESNTEDLAAGKSYSLYQNYPNPFNPNTTIKFEVPMQQNVKVVVYNLVGEVVAELFNGLVNAGVNEITFNADGLSSGMYIYKIITKNYVSTKKMILLK